MKIETQQPVFKPVVITLEDSDELHWLTESASDAYDNASSGSAKEKFFAALMRAGL